MIIPRRILIADDNSALLSAAGRFLRDAGYLVTSTNDGADTVCRLSSKPAYDLLILDLVMPGMDGAAVIRSLGPSAPPVILITGEVNTPEDIIKGGHVTRVLRKPFDGDVLIQAVSEVLEKSNPSKPDC